MTVSRSQLAAEIARASHALHSRGWVANHDGNISVRLPEGRFFVTPTATSKIDVTEGNLAVTDDQGKQAEGEARPPSEFALHLGIYAERPDVGAVVHAHPPYATALACSGQGITTFLAEAVVSIGLEVPVTDFALPFGAAGAEPIRRLIDRYDALLLCRHGVITAGKDVEQALLRLELVEHLAQIQTLALPHGGVRSLPADVLAPLLEKRRKAKLGLAAERSVLPSETDVSVAPEPELPEVPADHSAPNPAAWTPAGPPPAADAWSGGKAEGACSVVYGAGGVPDAGQLESAVAAAVGRHLKES